MPNYSQHSSTRDTSAIIDKLYDMQVLYVSADNATIQRDFQRDRTRQPCKRAGGVKRGGHSPNAQKKIKDKAQKYF